MPKDFSCDNLNRILTPNSIFSYDNICCMKVLKLHLQTWVNVSQHSPHMILPTPIDTYILVMAAAETHHRNQQLVQSIHSFSTTKSATSGEFNRHPWQRPPYLMLLVEFHLSQRERDAASIVPSPLPKTSSTSIPSGL